MKKSTFFFIFFLLSAISSLAQDDMMKLLEDNMPKKNEPVIATFKATRLVNFHTLETAGKRTLNVLISHRFGNINSGSYNFFGLDGGATIRLGLEYSFDGRFQFGIGRSSYKKEMDGFVKYRLFRQTTNNKMPVSITMVSSGFYSLLKNEILSSGQDKYHFASDRMSFCNQVIIGRKISEKFSLQIAPTIVHINLVEKATDHNDIYALSMAARFKLNKHIALTGEYAYCVNTYYSESISGHKYHNSAGFGFDIETGGHVFQIHLTNSTAITENEFIPFTQGSWKDFSVHLGFNISRVFTL